MRKLLLILLWPGLLWADSVSVGTPLQLSYYIHDWGYGYPRHHAAIDFNDSLEWWINSNRTGIWHTANGGASWDSLAMTGSGDMHTCVAINGSDSVLIWGNSPPEVVILYGGTKRTEYVAPTNWAFACLIGDPNNDRFWGFGRQGTPFTVNYSYAHTTNSGQAWTTGFIVEEVDDGRISSFWWPGYVPATSIFNFTDDWWHWYYMNGVAPDSMSDKEIATGTWIDGANRTFMFDVMETADDTLMMAIVGIEDTLVAYYKSYSGGGGAWTHKKLVVEPNMSGGTDWKPTMGIIGYGDSDPTMVFVWNQHYNATYLKMYMSWWDEATDSISTPIQVSRDTDTTYTGTGPNMVQYSPFNTSFFTYEGTGDSIWIMPLVKEIAAPGERRFVRIRR